MKSPYQMFRKSKLRNFIGTIKKIISREKNDFSQNLEYTRLKPILDLIPNKTVLDVGAHDGKSYSNSYPLLTRGWKGYLVEPNPINCQLIKKNCEKLDYILIEAAITPEPLEYVDLYFDSVTTENYRASIKKPNEDDWAKENLSSESVRVKAWTLDQLRDNFHIPSEIGLLSIDIEGLDTKVIQTMSQFRPYLIIIEIDFSSFDEARKKIKFLLDIGYINVFRVGCNEVFINTNNIFFQNREIKKFIENNF